RRGPGSGSGSRVRRRGTRDHRPRAGRAASAAGPRSAPGRSATPRAPKWPSRLRGDVEVLRVAAKHAPLVVDDLVGADGVPVLRPRGPRALGQITGDGVAGGRLERPPVVGVDGLDGPQ